MTQVSDLADALDKVLAQTDLSTAEKAQILVDQGWSKQAPAPVKYKSGDYVEVQVRGDWVPGQITNLVSGGLLDIAHERGSITVYAKSNVVRPQKK